MIRVHYSPHSTGNEHVSLARAVNEAQQRTLTATEIAVIKVFSVSVNADEGTVIALYSVLRCLSKQPLKSISRSMVG